MFFEKEIVMSHEEFIKWKYSNKKDKNYKKFVISGLAFGGFFISNPTTVMAITITNSTSKINEIGMSLLYICRTIGYWVSIMSSSVEVIKGAICHKDNNEIFKIIFKYLLIFGSLYFMKDLFDMVKEVFNG